MNAYEINNARLANLTEASFTMERHIDSYERRSIEIGDLKRAVKYNWLRNAYKQGSLTDDEVFFKIQAIHADSPTGIK